MEGRVEVIIDFYHLEMEKSNTRVFLTCVSLIRKHTYYIIHSREQRASGINDSQLGSTKMCLNSLLKNDTVGKVKKS
jgi:hypothetical protein